MKKVLVLGAGGQIARWVIGMLATKDDVKLTLFLRLPKKLKNIPKNAHVVQGDVLNKKDLGGAVAGQQIVYANLTGEDIDDQAKSIVEAMDGAKVKRLIFVAFVWNLRRGTGEIRGMEPPRDRRLSSTVSQSRRRH